MQKYKRALALLLCAVMVLPHGAALAGYEEEAPADMPVEDVFEGIFDGDAEGVDAEETEDSLFPQPVFPETEKEAPDELIYPEERPHEDAIWISYNGQLLELSTYALAINGTTFVPVRDFFEALGCTVEWSDTAKTVTVTREPDLQAVFQLNSRLARANSRCWYMDQPCVALNGSTMIPVRAAAKIFNAEVVWDSENQAVTLTGEGLLESGSTYYEDENDTLLWLARIIYHEAGNQPLDGKVAVGNVVMNRVNSPLFPNTVYEVLYDNRTGVQFLKESNTKIFREPNEESWLAAKLVMEGYVTAPDCLYFASVRKINSCWAAKHRTYYGSIGDHAFWQ